MVLALLAAPAFGQQVQCPFSVEPCDLQGIMLCYGSYRFRFPGLASTPDGSSGVHTVAEFEITAFRGEIRHVSFVVVVRNGSPGGDVGEIQLFTYIGDGQVRLMEYWACCYHSAVQMNDGGPAVPVEFDVTSFVLDAVAAGRTYAGFRLSPVFDYYDVYDVFLRCDQGVGNDTVSWGIIKMLAR